MDFRVVGIQCDLLAACQVEPNKDLNQFFIRVPKNLEGVHELLPKRWHQAGLELFEPVKLVLASFDCV